MQPPVEPPTDCEPRNQSGNQFGRKTQSQSNTLAGSGIPLRWTGRRVETLLRSGRGEAAFEIGTSRLVTCVAYLIIHHRHPIYRRNG